MPQKSERKFGAMEDWAKTGPIDLKNYSFRAESHCADHSGKRGGMHPIIKVGSPAFLAWYEYFEQHLGGLPFIFRRLVDKGQDEMTVPEQVPQWFDPSFTPTPGWQPR